jgi:hypothetical protein
MEVEGKNEPHIWWRCSSDCYSFRQHQHIIGV